MKNILVITYTLSFCFNGFSQNNFFYIDSLKQSNFDYCFMSKFEFDNRNSIDSAIRIIKGRETILRFVEVNYGLIEDSDSIVQFHRYLLLKVNEKHKILDAYLYTVGWSENPLNCALYRLKKQKSIRLKKGINLSELDFILEGEPENCLRDPILKLSQKLYW